MPCLSNGDVNTRDGPAGQIKEDLSAQIFLWKSSCFHPFRQIPHEPEIRNHLKKNETERKIQTKMQRD